MDFKNEIRITKQGSIQHYVSYAYFLLTGESEDKSNTQTESSPIGNVVLMGKGDSITKAITVAEILKRRIQTIYQINEIGIITKKGLNGKIKHTPSICIKLSSTPLDTTHPGYQIINHREIEAIGESGLSKKDKGSFGIKMFSVSKKKGKK